MKRYVAVVAAILLGSSMWVSQSSGQIGISINLGDRPFYDGPTYWDSGYEYVWVPGHDEHHHWVHGHYNRRGAFHREHSGEHHQHHDHH